MANPSPLRYPGGKTRLASFIGLMINNLNIKNCTYIEPFAGGAGVALALLLDGVVEHIVINDFDKAIYSFWRAIKQEPERLIDRIESTPITIEQWYKQKQVYLSSTFYSLDLAFATLFLNRTNRSGILNAGPIGGYSQEGDWHLDVRFDKKALITKIKVISEWNKSITVYNKDIISLLRNFIPKFKQNAFIYFDPPYFKKGQKLYKNFLTEADHKKIRDVIVNQIDAPWIVTYDDIGEIRTFWVIFILRVEAFVFSGFKTRPKAFVWVKDFLICFITCKV